MKFYDTTVNGIVHVQRITGAHWLVTVGGVPVGSRLTKAMAVAFADELKREVGKAVIQTLNHCREAIRQEPGIDVLTLLEGLYPDES